MTTLIEQADSTTQTVKNLSDLDYGAGTGGGSTLRVSLDTAQIEPSVPAGNPDLGNSTKMGSVATASLAAQTNVANGARNNAFSDVDGVFLTRSDVPLEDIVTKVVTCTAGANTLCIAAQGAGVKFYLDQVIVVNTGGAANGYVAVTDGSGGTTNAVAPYSTAGANIPLKKPVAFSANTPVYVDPSSADTCVVMLVGFKSKV